MAYSPIGQRARWSDNMRRGRTWSILPTYTVDGYLPCTSIREGFLNQDAFLDWVVNNLLPHYNPFPSPRSVVYLDNLSIHLDPRVAEAIEGAGCLIKFLPPYSPDYSPIELTFSILKAWMRRYFRRVWPRFNNDFGAFLAFAIDQSQCDQYAKNHFRYAGGGYIFKGNYEAFQRELDD